MGVGFIGTKIHLPQKFIFSSDFGHFILKRLEKAKNIPFKKQDPEISTFLREMHQARIQGGGTLGRAPTPGTEGPAPKTRVPSSQGQKEGTLVSLEWLFNTIQA